MTITKTRKYIKARKICNTFKHQSNFQLYAYLESQGYYWDNKIKAWKHIKERKDEMMTSMIIKINNFLFNELERQATIRRLPINELIIDFIESALTK